MAKPIIGFDISPLFTGHEIRGVGFYTQRLLPELKQFREIEIKELKSKEEIEREGYDLLHVPYFSPYFFSLPSGNKKPLIVTVHDLIPLKYPDHYPPGIKASLRWFWQKRLLKKAAAIITDSRASKKDIIEILNYPAEKIKVIYLAAGKEFKKIDSQILFKKIKEKHQLPDKFVLYVGDVNWNKNIPSLVKAGKILNIPLLIAGKQAVAEDFDKDHPENKDLVWFQKEAKENNLIRPLGFVATDELVVLYNLATVYCQPSFDEGFGLPVIEAMACGCPVVSSDRGPLPEIIGKAGILVKPSPEKLAKGIKKAIKEKETLITLGLKKAKEFSWQKTAKRTLSVYTQVMTKLGIDRGKKIF